MSLSLFFILLLSGCFGIVDNGAKVKPGDGSDDSGIKSISIESSTFTADNAGQVGVELSYSGDSNSNANVVLYYCSVRTTPGCDPLAGSSITLQKSGGKLIGTLDFRSATISGADVIKYKFVSSDVDGITGGDEESSLILPSDTSKLRKITQIGMTAFGLGASGEEIVNAMNVDSSGNIFLAGYTFGSLGEAKAGFSDAFVVKLTSTGALDTSFSSDGIVQLGNVTIGSNASGSETINAMNVDSSGNIFLAGETIGSLGEANAGGSDTFVVKLTSTGALDTSFSSDGLVQLGNVTIGANASGSDYINAMSVDSAGNIFIAGHTYGSLGEANAGSRDAFVVKLTSTGALDTSFSGDGVVQLGNVTIGANASWHDFIRALDVDSAGNIFLAGRTQGSLGEANAGGSDTFVVKLTTTGALDTSFSGDGIVQLGNVTIGANASWHDYIRAMNVDSSGNIFLAGYTLSSLGEANAGGYDAFVVKLTSTGALDTSFSSDGIVQFGNVTIGANASGNETINAMNVDSSGNIFLTGYTLGSLGEANAGSSDAFVVKLTSTGALDTSFSSDGLVQLGNVTIGSNASGIETFKAMNVDSSGNIFLAGHTQGSLGEANAGVYDAFVVKLTSTGALDTSFSSDGIVQLGNVTMGANASGWEYVTALNVDSAGNIFLAGYTSDSLGEANAGYYDAFVVKLTSTGALDTSFSSDGIVQFGNVTIGSGASGDEDVTAMSVDSAGNIFLAGNTQGSLGEANAGSGDAFVVKLTSTGALDTSFSSDGIVQLGNVTMGANASGNEDVTAMSVDSAGNIFLAGHTLGSLGEANAGGYDAFVVKLTSTGALDTSFSSDGIVQLGNVTIGSGASGDEDVTAMSVDSAGNIFLAGNTQGSLGEANAGGSDTFVVKLTSTGALDTSFSSDGIVQLGNVTMGANASGNEDVTAMSVDSSGSVFLAGYTTGSLGEANAGDNDAFVVKLTSTGALDTSFSSDGFVQLGNVTIGANASGGDYIRAMNVDSSGNIFLAGHTQGSLGEANAGSQDAFVVKLTSTGALDTSFSSDGIVQLGNVTIGANASVNDYVKAMNVDSSGNIFMGGYTSGSLGDLNSGSNDAFIAILSPQGNFD